MESTSRFAEAFGGSSLETYIRYRNRNFTGGYGSLARLAPTKTGKSSKKTAPGGRLASDWVGRFWDQLCRAGHGGHGVPQERRNGPLRG
jgi:hypothetical protein